jgi:hypothetical protein
MMQKKSKNGARAQALRGLARYVMEIGRMDVVNVVLIDETREARGRDGRKRRRQEVMK